MNRRVLKASSILCILVLCAAMLLGGCGGSQTQSESAGAGSGDSDTGAAPSGSGQLSVYTAYGEDESQFLFQAFEAATGIQVKSVRLSAGEIYARVQAESNNPQASIWFGTSVDTLTLAGQEGFLEAYTTPEADAVPADLRDPNGIWTPHTLAIMCFVSNDEWHEANNVALPSKWTDVLGEAYADQVILAHPGTSGMSYAWLSTVVQFFGEDEGFAYLADLDKNIFQYTKSGAGPARAVGLGESAVAFCWSSDAKNTQESGYLVSISYPEEGTGYEITGMALIKDGPSGEQENARMFIDWAASKEAQELFVNEYFRLPVHGEAAIPEGLTKATDVNLIELDGAWSADNRDRLIDKFETEIRGQENLS